MSNICEICNKVMGSKKNLARHKQGHLEENHICSLCSKSFTRKDNLKIHMTKRHDVYDKIVKLNADDMDTSINDDLTSDDTESVTEHTNHFDNTILSPEIEDEFKCHKCDKSFSLKRNLKRHISSHKKVKHKCLKCDKSSYRNDSIKRHEKSHHESSKQKSKIAKNIRFRSNRKTFSVTSVKQILRARQGLLHTPKSNDVLPRPYTYNGHYDRFGMGINN